MKDLTEHYVAGEQVFDGNLLKVYRDDVRLPDGSSGQREYIKHPGAVAVVPLFDDGSILLERQFRYPKHRHFIELPAGKLEKDEPPLATAKRELIEECGFEAGEWWKIVTLDPCIGYSTEVIEVFGARNLRHVGAKLDVGEHLESFEVKIAEALEWVRDGIITDTKTTLGLLWWAQWGSLPK